MGTLRSAGTPEAGTAFIPPFLARTGADIYGYFGLNPADNSYQAMEALTSYDNPLSVEVALCDSFLDLQQSNQHAGNPLSFGRPEATQ